ncbi:lysylphosphatidylglycerol synthase transmembrane domain-containing protein [Flavobacterium sp.]|uniref:lysylphosphatidylglycerol synthase transmembrane domain-containing protein n=1 Tax=Flavobacterium sp. TaxID=239 RepID=UPI0026070077|nr:lysylphosphatidylglycerol synthase transmembrane domain-containing protein [Flavobacterium sp.]
MKGKISTYLGVIIPILLGAGLTFYTYNSFTEDQRAEMKRYFVSANYNYVIISLFLAVFSYAARAYRWKYTLAQIGSYPGFTINFLAVSVGYFVNLSIPRSGEFSRALILKKYKEVPFDKAFGTIIAERIVDFFILLFFILLAVSIEFSTLKTFLLQYIPVQKLILLAFIGLAGFIGFLLVYNYSKWKFILLVKSKIEGLKEGVLSIFNMPNKWRFLTYTLLIWLSYFLMFYLMIFSLKATSSISMGTVLVAFVIGGLTMTFTNGGFGFFPVLIAEILFLYDIPIEAGNAFGWIVWISQLLITVLLGIFAFLALPIVTRKK